MLMQEFEEWREENEIQYEILSKDPSQKEYNLFSIFYQNRSFGENFSEMCMNLAFDIYNLQVCVEGLIEDMEELESEKKI
jgi:hypothetical protein